MEAYTKSVPNPDIAAYSLASHCIAPNTCQQTCLSNASHSLRSLELSLGSFWGGGSQKMSILMRLETCTSNNRLQYCLTGSFIYVWGHTQLAQHRLCCLSNPGTQTPLRHVTTLYHRSLVGAYFQRCRLTNHQRINHHHKLENNKSPNHQSSNKMDVAVCDNDGA